jgi:hypothetical protein
MDGVLGICHTHRLVVVCMCGSTYPKVFRSIGADAERTNLGYKAGATIGG